MSEKVNHLVIIDPQNDFCDLPASYLPTVNGMQLTPALAVPGAHADMQRLASFIDRAVDSLSEISVTLDSHHNVGIERATFWRKGDGSEVSPFTEITAASVRNGDFIPRVANSTARVLAYLDMLEAAQKYKLMVWPAHCEIGTWGHNVHDDIRAAYNRWEARQLGVVNKVTKGSNPWTEHYSAIMAEVPDAMDPSTQVNTGFLNILSSSDLVLIAGEAGSHCVKSTTEHIVQMGQIADKMVLLTDCMSPVAGFDAQYQEFLTDMASKGVRLATSTEMLAEVLASGRR